VACEWVKPTYKVKLCRISLLVYLSIFVISETVKMIRLKISSWLKNINFTLQQVRKEQRGSVGVPSLFTPGKEAQYSYGRMGGPQDRSEQVWKILPLLGFSPQTVWPVVSCYTICAILAPFCIE